MNLILNCNLKFFFDNTDVLTIVLPVWASRCARLVQMEESPGKTILLHLQSMVNANALILYHITLHSPINALIKLLMMLNWILWWLKAQPISLLILCHKWQKLHLNHLTILLWKIYYKVYCHKVLFFIFLNFLNEFF